MKKILVITIIALFVLGIGSAALIINLPAEGGGAIYTYTARETGLDKETQKSASIVWEKVRGSEDAVGIKDKMIAIRSTPAPVIWIEKKVNPEIEHGAATTGGEVTITMAVENRRDKEIFDIEVRDEFPEGFELIRGDTSMDLTSLKSGESKILKYELRALEAGYFVLKPATLTYKDESGVQYSNKSNTAEVMVRAPPPELLIPEFVALFVIVGLLAVAVVAAYLVLRGLK